MTYCVGMMLDTGLVMVADSRTNAGVDHISTFRKMTIWEVPDERVIILLTAGNLAVTQSVVNLLNEGTENGGDDNTILSVPTMFGAARLVGQAAREVYDTDGEAMKAQGIGYSASMILGGQIKGRTMRLFQVYNAGNFIEATPDTPFFQIGEVKYGKPILDRALTSDVSLTDAVKLGLVSMDSTIRSNISVGHPIDVAIYQKDSCRIARHQRIEDNDPYFTDISQRWSAALQAAFLDLPDPDW